MFIKNKFQKIVLFPHLRYLASLDSPNSFALLGPENELTANDNSWTIRKENLGWTGAECTRVGPDAIPDVVHHVTNGGISVVYPGVSRSSPNNCCGYRFAVVKEMLAMPRGTRTWNMSGNFGFIDKQKKERRKLICCSKKLKTKQKQTKNKNRRTPLMTDFKLNTNTSSFFNAGVKNSMFPSN